MIIKNKRGISSKNDVIRGRVNRYLVVMCLLLISFYSQGSIIVHHTITGGAKHGRLFDVFNVALLKIVPVVPSLIAFGKFIVNRIKNKKNNRVQNNAGEVYHKRQINMKQVLKQQRGQLQDLDTLYYHYFRQEMPSPYKGKLQQRSPEIKKLLRGKIRLTTRTYHWPYFDSEFAQKFDFLSNKSEIVEGVKLQHILGEEFYDITKKTEILWRQHYEDRYIQQLIKRSVACTKEGMAYNKSGEVVKASIFADVGWAILDHIQAIGEGMYQGTIKAMNAFLHPIKITRNKSEGAKQFIHSLGQVTLEIIDFYMLAIKSPNAAQKKLQIWQQNFSALLNKINEEWHITTNRDITKFIATFVTERVVIHSVFNGLGKVFMIARVNAAKLAQKKAIQLAMQAQQIAAMKEANFQRQTVESLQDMPQRSLRLYKNFYSLSS